MDYFLFFFLKVSSPSQRGGQLARVKTFSSFLNIPLRRHWPSYMFLKFDKNDPDQGSLFPASESGSLSAKWSGKFPHKIFPQPGNKWDFS